MEESPFLPLPEGMLIDQVEQTDTKLTVTVISTRTDAVCPDCGHASEYVHCQYQRTVHDVPSGGRQVVLRLCVRKFFCRDQSCQRKVFAERIPDLVQPWGRCSHRLLESLKAIGLSASAEVSERLAPRLAMPVKASTLLRYLRTIPDPPRTNVISLGIDDFALKRGDKYGTILVNAETGKPLDLLPDRTTEAVSPWLASHPEIQVVSRDRANGFAEAVSQVLPHATQVADRYHLIQNLRDHLQQFLDRKRTCLPFVEDTPVGAKEGSPGGKGTSPSDRQLHLSRNTVQRYISSSGFPQRAQGTGLRPKGTSKLDPYLPYLRDQWDAGIHNAAHLFNLVKARGYKGCESMLRMRLSEWRAELPKQRWRGNPPKPRLFQQARQRRLSSRAASSLMLFPAQGTSRHYSPNVGMNQSFSSDHNMMQSQQEHEPNGPTTGPLR